MGRGRGKVGKWEREEEEPTRLELVDFRRRGDLDDDGDGAGEADFDGVEIVVAAREADRPGFRFGDFGVLD